MELPKARYTVVNVWLLALRFSIWKFQGTDNLGRWIPAPKGISFKPLPHNTSLLFRIYLN